MVKRWVAELDIASGAEKDWRKCSDDTWKLYKSEKQSENSFNILWSNTETLRPALYNSMPSPDVRRRFRDADPMGKYGSLIIERALTYSIDDYDFDKAIQDTVLDVLLPGRGVARIKYEPKFSPIPGTEPDPLTDEKQPEEISYEQALCCHVGWDKFRRGPGESWEEVAWIAFEHRMPKDQLVEMFGEELAEEIPLSESEVGTTSKDKTLRSLVKTAKIWEIWDKSKRRVLFICEQYSKKPLREEDDPLRLDDFFPVPRPIYAIEDSTSLIPQTLYEKYKIQAEELNKVTRRIDKVVAALKVRGAYASNLSEIATIIEAADNQMIPIVNASEVAAMGGLDKAIWILPIDKLAGVLTELYLAREKTLQTIYEITGLGDIMRGVSNPHETLGAQQLKSQWGTLRLQRLQREVQRFIRDLMRLKAEVIAEHFQEKTLRLMTGIELPSPEDKQKLQMQMQQAQMSGQEVNPDMQSAAEHVLTMPTWPDVMQLLRSDQMRRFRIGIETDSTIQETLTRDSQAMQEAITAVVNLFTGLAPAIQMGAMSIEVAKTIALSMARNAKMGEAVEEAIEQMKQPPPPPPPPPDTSIEVANIKAQSEQAATQAKTQSDQAIAQLTEQNAQQLKGAELQHKKEIEIVKAEAEKVKAAAEARVKEMEIQTKKAIAEMQERVKIAIAQMQVAADNDRADRDRQHEAQQKDADRKSTAEVEDKKISAQRESDTLKAGTEVVGHAAESNEAAEQRDHEAATAGADRDHEATQNDANRKHEKETAASGAEKPKKKKDAGGDTAKLLQAIQALVETHGKPKRITFETDKKGNIVGATAA